MDTMSDILRQATRESGLSIRRISIHTGLGRLSITRFLDGYQLTSNNIDALAHYLGLTLTAIPTPKRTRKK